MMASTAPLADSALPSTPSQTMSFMGIDWGSASDDEYEYEYVEEEEDEQEDEQEERTKSLVTVEATTLCRTVTTTFEDDMSVFSSSKMLIDESICNQCGRETRVPVDCENETVCLLCCEELDVSDQQFFPCKCGYQVCMWHLNYIRESESGLCPSCHTPYGYDTYEFSAVDVAEVLKDNKEKVAAEKKERERLRDGDEVGVTDMMDLPKDRSQLANMRVILRHLAYVKGLPSSIAAEDTLRKPEYFGQYGKIAKIVLNRTNVISGDPGHACASAYVTFVHKVSEGKVAVHSTADTAVTSQSCLFVV